MPRLAQDSRDLALSVSDGRVRLCDNREPTMISNSGRGTCASVSVLSRAWGGYGCVWGCGPTWPYRPFRSSPKPSETVMTAERLRAPPNRKPPKPSNAAVHRKPPNAHVRRKPPLRAHRGATRGRAQSEWSSQGFEHVSCLPAPSASEETMCNLSENGCAAQEGEELPGQGPATSPCKKVQMGQHGLHEQ